MADERRLVTILFADVAGSTGLGEALDPEDLRALLGRFFAIAREVVAEHGGTLEKFIGDAVMAVFGLPVAHDDDPVRACAAALALRDRVRDDPGLGDRLPIRIGVNSGEVVANRDAQGGGDFMVTGDAVNVAARLQQGAEPWSVVAGERTVAAATDAFSFGPLEAAEARGRVGSVRSAVVLSRSPRQRRRPPFVGRAADLAQLQLVSARVADERRPYLISILAPPGTGKSRLVERFLEDLRPGGERPLVLVAQCLPYGSQLTYWPLRSVLAGLAGHDAGATSDQEAILRDLAAHLGDLGIEDATGTAKLLAATVGMGGEEAIDEPAIIAAWRRALEAASARQPVVLVIEDLHWSSDALLVLLESLLALRSETPMLVLAIARPELLDRRPTWGGGRRNHVSIALEPLPQRDVAALVAGVLEGATPDIVDAIVARADGNPFFAGELARSLVDRVGSGVAGPSAQDVLRDLPDTVQGVVLARLDRLGPAGRRAVQVAAVLGRSFERDALVALDATLADGLEPTIDELLDRDLVRYEARDELAFRHILIREVAYSMLPRAERARLHAAAGAWLEADAGDRADEVAELIAFHYREAAGLRHLLEPDAAEAIRRQAVEWLRRAARVAAAAAANVEGARHLRAAIAMAEREEQPDLLEMLGVIRGYGTEAAVAFADARRLAIELGRPPEDQLRLVAAEAIIATRWAGGSPSAPGSLSVDELLAEGARLAPHVSDPRTLCAFNVAKGFQGFREGAHNDGGVEASTLALSIAREIDDAGLQSAALDALASHELDVGSHAAALAFTEQRVAMASRLPIFERLDAWTMVAWTATILGRLDRAEAGARSGLADLPPSRVSSFTLSLLGWSAVHAMLRGRWDEATAMASQAAHAWEELERDAAGYAQQGFQAALFIARARRDEPLIDRWRSIIEEIAGHFVGEDLPAVSARRQLAIARADVAEIERAYVTASPGLKGREDYRAHALTIAADRWHAFNQADLRRVLAIAEEKDLRLVSEAARRALGIVTRDPALLRAAIEGYEAMGAPPFVARTQADLGLITGDAALIETASATLSRLGDIDQLSRIEARRTGR